jgi:hypothetical protein
MNRLLETDPVCPEYSDDVQSAFARDPHPTVGAKHPPLAAPKLTPEDGAGLTQNSHSSSSLNPEVPLALLTKGAATVARVALPGATRRRTL